MECGETPSLKTLKTSLAQPKLAENQSLGMSVFCSKNQKIIDWFGFEGTIKAIEFQSPATDQDTLH